MTRRSFTALPLVAAAAPLLPTRGELDLLIQRVERELTRQVLDFWVRQTVDPAGGYQLNHDAAGKPKGAGVRTLPTQAGMIAFYSRMARMGHEPKKMIELADHGFRYLRERFWDGRNGGFYWEVDAVGKPTRTNKHLYAQACAMHALAEFALATNRKEPRELALNLFQVLEKQSHDPVHGGYVEYFLTDWATPPVNEPIYLPGSATGMKLMQTHLRLLEALTSLNVLARNPVVRDRLSELLLIESIAVYREPHHMAADRYDRDWSPRLDTDVTVISYGDNLANLWLLANGCRSAAVPLSGMASSLRFSMDQCRRFGLDATGARFATSGVAGQPATDSATDSTCQADAMAAALLTYQLTSNTEYFELFRKLWKFVDARLSDRMNGDWHAGLAADATPRGDKASTTRCAYSHGRALFEVLTRLRSIREKSS